MVKIIWTERSLKDLDDIAEYIAKDSIKYAKITVEKLMTETMAIQGNPHLGRIVPEFSDKRVREIIKGNYRIIYKVGKQKAEILTVHHSARDLRRRNILPVD